MTSTPAIRIRGAVKRFGAITAVDGLDLDVAPGECLGLLGPNGAGKSTTMRMLTGQAVADAGEIRVFGFRLPEESKESRALCGVVPQQDNLDVELSVREVLEVSARLYRVGRHERDAAVDHALRTVNLAERAGSPVDELSGGMRRRLLIARALVHGPRLLLLDEPTVGLDPQVRQELWGVIGDLRAGGVTVLMSTHYIEEAERLADRVAVVSSGRVVAHGTPSELVRAHAGREVIEIYGPPRRLDVLARDAAAQGLRTRRRGTALAYLATERYLGAARFNGSLPEGVERRAATLEDAFVALTGEEGT